jgi:hypothetical protein
LLNERPGPGLPVYFTKMLQSDLWFVREQKVLQIIVAKRKIHVNLPKIKQK